ncbi:MAG: hypothetical protein LC749_07115, partial [Actinobacteria bacterium]|nr:hypothetical protein [Actinomycetota bacterium]
MADLVFVEVGEGAHRAPATRTSRVIVCQSTLSSRVVADLGQRPRPGPAHPGQQGSSTDNRRRGRSCGVAVLRGGGGPRSASAG